MGPSPLSLRAFKPDYAIASKFEAALETHSMEIAKLHRPMNALYPNNHRSYRLNSFNGGKEGII